MKTLFFKTVISTTTALLLANAAWAGRPLSVDDANVNDAGKGHVETWFAHESGSTAFYVAPAYAIRNNLELSAVYGRESQSGANAMTLQAKYRISQPQDNGCNTAVAGGVTHYNQGGGNAPYIYGAVSCNVLSFAVHGNVGGLKPSGASGKMFWGIAAEKPFGNVTAHAEVFATEGERMTKQVGLRTNLSDNIQLDGTVGRQGGFNKYSIGMKFSF